jgi:hypothetical protein
MNKIILFAALLMLASPVYSQSKQQNADEKAIMEVIENESRHFWARDFKKWKKQWIQEPYVIWTAASEAGVRQYHGWDAWEKEVLQLFEESPEPMPYDGVVEKKNYTFRIYDNGAWVSFEQENEGTRTYETRIMEKKGGKWRIAAVQLFFNAN